MSRLQLIFKEKQNDLSIGFGKKPRVSLAFKGMGVATQVKTATPTDTEQVITADEGYYLSSVTIEAIPSNYGRIGYNGGVLSVY